MNQITPEMYEALQEQLAEVTRERDEAQKAFECLHEFAVDIRDDLLRMNKKSRFDEGAVWAFQQIIDKAESLEK